MKKKRVAVYDTTLRDGAQAIGVSFSAMGKILLAKRLDAFGVDYIEGGFPGSNPKDMEFFNAIAKETLRYSKVVAFGSTRRARKPVRDDPFVKALLAANTPTVTVFGKSWKLHVKDVLRTSEKENLAMIGDTVAYLKDHGKEVFFDAEHYFDGFKDSPEFALKVLRAAAGAGADCLVLCDTCGGSLPSEVVEAMNAAKEQFDVPLGIHTHDDIGLGVANSLAGVAVGAVQVQGTMNGYGERCGNANLCTVIPNLKLKMGVECVRSSSMKSLTDLSLFVDDMINLRPNQRAPYVGKSAFCHKGGPHVDAVRKNPRTFEHVGPERVGNQRTVLVSELSGGSNVLLKAVEVGLHGEASKEETREILEVLKKMEHEGYAFEAADASFRILVQKVMKKHKSFFDLEGFRVIVERRGKDQECLSEATVKVRVNGEMEQTVAEGDGPVNALDRALRKALERFYPEIAKVQLKDFRVRILDPEEASAATTRVLIESSDGTENWGTVGVSENIIEASWEALVDSVEYKLFREEEKGKPGRRKNSK